LHGNAFREKVDCALRAWWGRDRQTGRALMPGGFEASLDPSAMADLAALIARPPAGKKWRPGPRGAEARRNFCVMPVVRQKTGSFLQ